MAKGKITIDENICKGCELCVSVCPKKVLKLSETKLQKFKRYLSSESNLNESLTKRL